MYYDFLNLALGRLLHKTPVGNTLRVLPAGPSVNLAIVPHVGPKREWRGSYQKHHGSSPGYACDSTRKHGWGLGQSRHCEAVQNDPSPSICFRYVLDSFIDELDAANFALSFKWRKTPLIPAMALMWSWGLLNRHRRMVSGLGSRAMRLYRSRKAAMRHREPHGAIRTSIRCLQSSRRGTRYGFCMARLSRS